MIVLQILIAIILIALILLSQQGAGVGSALGGLNTQYHTKRGAEKVLFWGITILTAIFVILSIANILLASK